VPRGCRLIKEWVFGGTARGVYRMDDVLRRGSTLSTRLGTALALPNGARFYRCALQVNTFGYLVRHNKITAYRTEAQYNSAIIQSCHNNGIEVIAVTDHYRVHESAHLIMLARDSGIFAFGGFEAVTKDGVHFLCLFDADKDTAAIERLIGECGVHNRHELSPTGDKDCLELLEAAKRWGGVCIASHVAADGGGLLKKLSGQSRLKVWHSSDLHACALAGPIDQAPENLRAILNNKDGVYRRERQVAVINAQDVNAPEDLTAPGASCFIKMSKVSVEGLRCARRSWRGPAGESPAQVRGSACLVTSVALGKATTTTKRTQ